MSSIYQKANKAGAFSLRKSKTFAKGRVCKQDGCDVTLSMYNKKEFCFNHSPIDYGRNRGWIDPSKKKS